MACLIKFAEDYRLGCGAPPAGPLMKPVGAFILNPSDIASYTIAPGGIATITRVPTAVGVPIEVANNSLVITVALKGGEVAAQAFDVTAEFSIFKRYLYSAMDGSAVRHGPNSQIVLAVNHGNGVYQVYGLGAPLECLSLEGDTTGNGFVRVTFGVEDWQSGTTIAELSKKDYEALALPAPAPAPEPEP